MRWLNGFTFATGLIGMTANILGILTYLEARAGDRMPARSS